MNDNDEKEGPVGKSQKYNRGKGRKLKERKRKATNREEINGKVWQGQNLERK